MMRNTTWRKQIEAAMKKRNESFNDMQAITLTEAELDEDFDNWYGSEEGKPFTAWTKNTVYFPVCYDGAEWVGSVSRNPDGKSTEHQGG